MRNLDETPVLLTTERLELLLGGARILDTRGLPSMAQNVIDSMNEEAWLAWTRQRLPPGALDG